MPLLAIGSCHRGFFSKIPKKQARCPTGCADSDKEDTQTALKRNVRIALREYTDGLRKKIKQNGLV